MDKSLVAWKCPVLPGGLPAFYICYMKHELGYSEMSECLTAFFVHEYEAHDGSQTNFVSCFRRSS